MKRSVALLLALLFIALPALAEQAEFSPFDHRIQYTANGKYIVYVFPDIRFLLPIEWENAITVEQSDSGAAFYQTASLERYRAEGVPGGGFLFELCVAEDESYLSLPAFVYLGFSENSGQNFYLRLPSDYPAYPEDDIRAEYDRMIGEMDLVVEKASIRKSILFYTEDLEIEDGNGLA